MGIELQDEPQQTLLTGAALQAGQRVVHRARDWAQLVGDLAGAGAVALVGQDLEAGLYVTEALVADIALLLCRESEQAVSLQGWPTSAGGGGLQQAHSGRPGSLGLKQGQAQGGSAVWSATAADTTLQLKQTLSAQQLDDPAA